jgi:hypothetical protein
MNKSLLLTLFMEVCIGASGQVAIGASGQVGIGTITPHSSAKLEISSANKGFLIPRVVLTGTADVTTIPSPATGLMVYNTATAGTSPANVTPGFYYYSQGKWQRMDNQMGTAWYLSGTATDAGGDKSSTIYRSGAVGIGSSNPSGTLEVGSPSGDVSGFMIVNPENTAYEGGQIILKKSVSGSNNDWVLDQYADAGGAYKRFRIFSTGGEDKGLAIMESGDISLNPTGANLSGQTDKLQVNGSAKMTGNLNAKGEGYAAAGQATTMYAWSDKGDFALPMTDISGQDPNNWWQGDPNYRFLPTIPGYYFIQAQVNWATSATNVAMRIKLQKNSTVLAVTEDVSNTSVSTTQKVTAIVYLNGSTDFVKLLVYSGSNSLTHNITGNQAYTKFEAFKIN